MGQTDSIECDFGNDFYDLKRTYENEGNVDQTLEVLRTNHCFHDINDRQKLQVEAFKVYLYYSLDSVEAQEKSLLVLDSLIAYSDEVSRQMVLFEFVGHPYLKTLIEKRLKLEEVEENPFLFVVEVTKHKTGTDMAPSVITVYTDSMIRDLGARNLIDLLRITPGFLELGDMNERNYGTRAIQGTTAQHVLILINGHKIPDLLTSTTAPDWISLDYVKQVEIVRGPGSALYGGNAMSGVINIVTKNGMDFPKQKLKLEAGNGKTLRGNFESGARFSTGGSLYLSGSYLQSDGIPVQQDVNRDLNESSTYMAQGGTEYVNGYLPSYSFLLNYQRGGTHITGNMMQNSLLYQRSFVGYGLGLRDDTSSNNTYRRLDRRNFIQWELSMPKKHNRSNGFIYRASFDHFYFDDFLPEQLPLDTVLILNEDTLSGAGNLVGNERRATAEIQYNLDNAIGNGDKFTIFGAEISYTDYHYSRTIATYDENGQYIGMEGELDGEFFKHPDGWDSLEITYSAYIQSQAAIIPNKLFYTAGLRMDHHSIYGSKLSPRVALIWKPIQDTLRRERLKLKLLANEAFLPPPFLYRSDHILPQFQGVDNLRTQNIRSLELVGFGVVEKTFNYSVNAFYNNVHRFIRIDGDGLYNNLGELKVIGLEGSFNFRHQVDDNLIISNFVNFALIKDAGSSAYFVNDGILVNWPEFSASAGVNARRQLRNKEAHLNGNISVNYIGTTPYRIPDDIAIRSPNPEYNGYYNIPANFLLHMAGHYQINKYVTTGLLVHNVFNQLELLPGSTPIPRTGEGRSVILQLRFNLN